MNDDWITPPGEADDWAAPADDWVTPGESMSDTRARVGQEAGAFLGIPQRPQPAPPAAEPYEPAPLPEFQLPDPAPIETGYDRQARAIEGIQTLGRVPDRADIIRDQGAAQAAQIEAINPQDYANPALTYQDATLGQRAREQIGQGFDDAAAGLAGFSAARVVQELDLLDRADRGETLPPRGGTGMEMNWDRATPEQRARARAIRERQLANALRSYLGSTAASAARLRNPAVQQLAEAVDGGDYSGAWRIFASDPAGILQQLSVSSLPHSIAPMALGIAGGFAGLVPGLAAAGLGSLASDAGPRFVEMLGQAMQEAGIDAQNPEAVAAYFRENPGKIGELRAAAGRGASVVALADILSFGLAGGIRRGAGALRNAGRVGRNMALEIGTEGAGEAGAQMASTGQVTPSEVLFEMLGAGPQVAGTTAFGTIQELRQRVPVRQPPAAPLSPLTPEQQSQDAAAQGAAPATPSPPAAVPPSAETPPPPSVAAPALDSATEGQSAPTGVAALPPSPAPPQANSASELSGALGNMGAGIGQSLRDGLWLGYQGQGAMRIDPIVQAAQAIAQHRGRPYDQASFLAFAEEWSRSTQEQRRRLITREAFGGPPVAPDPLLPESSPSAGVPVAEGSEPAAGPAGGAAPAPSSAVTPADEATSPPSAPAPGAALPPIPPPAPPPPVNAGRTSLEATLTAPTAEQRAATVARWQSLLPPGFTVTDEGDHLSVTQPDGDVLVATEVSPQESIIQDSARVARDMVAQGLFAPPAAAAPEAPPAVPLPSPADPPAAPASWWDALGRQERRRIASAAGVSPTRAMAAWASLTPETQAKLEAARNAPVSQPAAPDVTTPPAPPSENNAVAEPNVTTPPVPRPRRPAKPAAPALDLGERQQRSGPMAVVDAMRAGRAEAKGEVPLVSWIIKNGGINPRSDRGELWAQLGKGREAARYRPGLFNAQPRRFIEDPTGKTSGAWVGGMRAENAWEKAIEDGYLPEGSTVDDLYAAIGDELAGRRQFLGETEDVQGRDMARQAAEIDRVLDEAGLSLKDSDEAIQAALDAAERAVGEAPIREAAKEAGARLTDEEVAEAARLVREQGMAPEDAVFLVVERGAIQHENTLHDLAPEGTEWEIPFDEGTAAARSESDADQEPAPEGGPSAGPDPGAEAGGASPGGRDGQAGEAGGPEAGGAQGEPAGDLAAETVDTLDGKREQTLIPGVAPVTDRDRLQVQADKPLRGGNAPPPAGGLFDEGATKQQGLPLYSTPFDPALFARMVKPPAWLREWMEKRGLAPVTGVNVRDERPRDKDGKFVDKHAWVRTTKLTPILNTVILPQHLLKGTPFERFQHDAQTRMERMDNWQQRIEGEFDDARKEIEKGGGKFENVQVAVWLADHRAIPNNDQAQYDALFDELGLNEAERGGYANVRALYDKVGRLVDQHKRAMAHWARKRKIEVFAAQMRLLESAKVPTAEYASANRRRLYLRSRLRAGLGDPAKITAELAEVEARLRTMREADPAVSTRLTALQEEYEELEAKIAETSVRERRQSYAGHKFFGSWRLFRVEGQDADGQPILAEINSDQGFFGTEQAALRAAKEYEAENPGTEFIIRRKAVMFPGSGGTQVTDASHARLMRDMEKQTEMSREEVREMLSGVVSKRGRRRSATFNLRRGDDENPEGHQGFARDLDRAFRAHVAQAVRYVALDRLKFDLVSLQESTGTSPLISGAGQDPRLKEASRVVDAYWRDVTGGKQPLEAALDTVLSERPIQIPAMTAAATFLAVAPASPVIAAGLAGYVGGRSAYAIAKGGDFPTRSTVDRFVSDQAQMKLGLFFNLASPVVNLSQVMTNVWPLLKEKWTGVGLKRAADAFATHVPAFRDAMPDSLRKQAERDARLLERANIKTSFGFADWSPTHAKTLRGFRYYSMWGFTKAEEMNRAVAFLGAYHRAIDRGATPGKAFSEARALNERANFHGSNANRPEFLRQQWARMPTQFWNYWFNQIAFAYGLRKEDAGTILRFLAAMFILGGLLALPFLLLPFDWLFKHLFKTKLSEIVTRSASDWMLALGLPAWWGQVIARGAPAAAGVDISGRLGMGRAFLPDQLGDLAGPAIGTAIRLNTLASLDAATTADYLSAVAPALNWLKVLEAASNGADLTSAATLTGRNLGDGRARWTAPFDEAQTDYEPTTGELVRRGLGFQPLAAAQMADLRAGIQASTQRRRELENRYLAQIVQAVWDGRPEDIRRIQAEARQAGAMLTQQRIVEKVREAHRTRVDRQIQTQPRRARPDLIRQQQQIEEIRGSR